MSSTNPISLGRGRKKSLYFVLIAGIVVFALASVGLNYFLKPTNFRVAVGPPDSDDQKLIKVMSDTFARDRSPVRLSVVVTAGSPESVDLFASGKVDLAIARGDLTMPRNAEMVAILRKDYAVLWSIASPLKKDRQRAVKSISDLEGRTVGVIGRTQSNPTLLRVILSASGVDPNKVSVKQFATSQVEEMAGDTTLSAFLAVGPVSSRITSSAITSTARIRGQPKFLAVEVSEAIAQKNPVYEAEEIPASSFSAKPAWPDDKLETVSVSHLIIAQKSLSETKVASLTRQILTNRQGFSRELASGTQLQKPDTDKDAALPVHRGAAAYVDNNERSFLDGYSDYIWFGILALSGIGSAVAWLRKFLAREEWEGSTALCEKIGTLTERAREAASVRDLDMFESEVDSLISETLHCYDNDLLEEEDLSVLTLLFQRFHHIVSLRARALSENSDGEARLRAV